jgi:hypothetical protein
MIEKYPMTDKVCSIINAIPPKKEYSSVNSSQGSSGNKNAHESNP